MQRSSGSCRSGFATFLVLLVTALWAPPGLADRETGTTQDGPDARRHNGDTELIAAAKAGHVDRVTRLLERGANPELTNSVGSTALFLASRNGHEEVVKVLLAWGVDVNASNRVHHTALIGAVDGQHAGIAKALLSHGAKTDLQDEYKRTALFEASRSGQREIVEALLARGADPDLPNRKGNTALIWASRNGYDEIVKLLLARKPALELKNNRGDNALHWAVMSGRAGIASALLAAGANANIVNSDGNAALAIAVARRDAQIARALLAHGAKVDALSHGWTALQLAASDGNGEIASVLLEHHADPNRVDPLGLTSLALARRAGADAAAKVLESNAAKMGAGPAETPLTTAGLYVDEEGHFVTTLRAVDACGRNVRIVEGEQSVGARLIAADPENDLALLGADVVPESTAAPVRAGPLLPHGKVNALSFGQTPATAGNLLAANGTLAIDRDRRSDTREAKSILEFDLSGPALAAGGPVLDQRGNVVGVTLFWRPWSLTEQGRLDFSRSLADATSSENLASFLEAQGLSHATERSGRRLDPERLLAAGLKFTRRMECGD